MTIDFVELPDLASAGLGGRVIYANDEFFAAKEGLLKPEKPVFIDDKYTERGKWMDGWESRRRRQPGHDHCIVKLGTPGIVRGVIVDTTHFRGNNPEACSLEGCSVPGTPSPAELETAEWIEFLPRTMTKGHTENRFAVSSPFRFTHIRLYIYPDGGVARLRVHGEPLPSWWEMAFGGWIDLAAMQNGARVVACSDMFFGVRHNLIMPRPAQHMGEGWETRRRRGPGNDWCAIALAAAGQVRKVELDTSHFKGNAPDHCTIEISEAAIDESTDLAGVEFRPLLSETKLQPDSIHVFGSELLDHAPARSLRLSVYPDGGVARLRVWGEVDEKERRAHGLRWLNALPPATARKVLQACCGSSAYSAEMVERRPFADASQLLATSDEVWRGLSSNDWLEGFRAHPRIGERASASADPQHAKWSSVEQASTHAAAEAVRAQLVEANRSYEQKFGHIFVICASGKSPDEMLVAARARLANSPSVELRIAAEEQRQITTLRLGKVLAS